MEPSLGPDIFGETDSESDSVSKLTHHLIPDGEWITWHENEEKCTHIVDENSAMIREYLESHMIELWHKPMDHNSKSNLEHFHIRTESWNINCYVSMAEMLRPKKKAKKQYLSTITLGYLHTKKGSVKLKY